MSRDGMNYAPDMSGIRPVVKGREFVFAASHFDHGHIYSQIQGLAGFGGCLKLIYDTGEGRIAPVLDKIPDARVVDDFQEILDDPEIHLVTSAAVPDERCAVGLKVMEAGKDYLTDKAPFTTLDQLEKARGAAARTGRKYMVCYSERLCSESAFHAGELIHDGALGRVLQVVNLAPHNLAPETRPEWFFRKSRFGGILTDIGSHQFEQFLHYTGAREGSIEYARTANLGHEEYPEFEDFGEAAVIMDTGASAYCRLDWFNPAGSRTWGDGRTFVLGTKGYLEIRKYVDLARDDGDTIYLVDDVGENRIECSGKVGFPFFGRLITDVLERRETAMTQEHAFKAAELSLKAQGAADGMPGGASSGAVKNTGNR